MFMGVSYDFYQTASRLASLVLTARETRVAGIF